MKYRTISTILVMLVILVVFSVYASQVHYVAEHFVDSDQITLYSGINMTGKKLVLDMKKQNHIIPADWVGKIKSVEVPRMYALLAYNDTTSRTIVKPDGNAAFIKGNINDLEDALKKVPTWTGTVKSVLIAGEHMQVFKKPGFQGNPLYVPSLLGTATYQGGPRTEKDAKTYKRDDIMSFIIPRGMQLIVTTSKGVVKTSTIYPAGNYENTVIPDVKGVQIALRPARWQHDLHVGSSK